MLNRIISARYQFFKPFKSEQTNELWFIKDVTNYSFTYIYIYIYILGKAMNSLISL